MSRRELPERRKTVKTADIVNHYRAVNGRAKELATLIDVTPPGSDVSHLEAPFTCVMVAPSHSATTGSDDVREFFAQIGGSAAPEFRLVVTSMFALDQEIGVGKCSGRRTRPEQRSGGQVWPTAMSSQLFGKPGTG